MRFRLTALLIFLNAVVFTAIWLLERDPTVEDDADARLSDFTVLEVMGKSIDKPRVVRLENNRWRITSPIEWPANFFAINRIRSQLEFLDRQTSFAVSEIQKHGQTLSDYGLDDPTFVFRYGGESGMHTLKVGKTAPIGNRIYMLDENLGKIVVVDKELVESLAVDIERLRSQDVFEIPRFEINAISIRIPQADGGADQGAKFRRIGLVREGENWKFETPIVAPASGMLVEAFINSLCSISAKTFIAESGNTADFDISAFPMTISISGTNRRQVLLLGSAVPGTDQIYAKLEDNPTVFTLDAETFKDFKNIQTSLRDRSFLKFNALDAVGVDVSDGNERVRLRNLKSGLWEVSSKMQESDADSFKPEAADPAIVGGLITALHGTTARAFVSDAPGENLAPYGLDKPKLKITVHLSDKSTRTLSIGNTYKLGGATLAYARLDSSPSIYAIATGILNDYPANPLFYKSRVLDAIPEKGVLKQFAITDIESGRVVCSIVRENAQDDIEKLIAKITPARRRDMSKKLCDYAKRFVVQKFLKQPFDEKGVQADSKLIPWKWKFEAVAELPGTGKTIEEKKTWLLTDRVSGTLQYGGSAAQNAVFELPQSLMEAVFEFTAPELEKAIKSPAVAAPAPKPAETQNK